MRKTTLGTNQFIVTYPDENTFNKDRNVLICEDTRTTKNGFTLSVTIAGRTAEYHTDMAILVVDINDTLSLGGYASTLSAVVQVVTTGTLTMSTSFKHHQGKTLASRTHGAIGVIQLEDLHDEFQIYAPYGGLTLTDEGEDIDLSQGLNDGLSFSDPKGWAFYKDADGGRLIGERTNLQAVEGYKVRFIERPCGEVVKLLYTDADGCRRMAFGKLMETQTSVEATEYSRVTEETSLSHTPARVVDSVAEVLRFGFANIDPRQYLEDMLISEEVLMPYTDPEGGATQLALYLTPTTMSVAKNGETNDYIFEFKILR